MSVRQEDILKECYSLALGTCTEGQVHDIIDRKLRQLNANGNTPSGGKCAVPTMALEILSNALAELSESDTEADKRNQSVYYGQVLALPQSAERDYILALYALQDGVSNENAVTIITYLNAALSSSEKANYDPRYRALASIIREMKS